MKLYIFIYVSLFFIFPAGSSFSMKISLQEISLSQEEKVRVINLIFKDPMVRELLVVKDLGPFELKETEQIEKDLENYLCEQKIEISEEGEIILKFLKLDGDDKKVRFNLFLQQENLSITGEADINVCKKVNILQVVEL